MSQQHWVYILASKRNGALYLGLTTDLADRVFDHKCNLVPGLTSQYAIHQLVYYERHEDLEWATGRLNSIRDMHRIWKLDLIEQQNPDWRDLYDEIARPQAMPG